MNKVTLIKKVKANLIRLKVHKVLGWAANLLIYTGYMIKLSKWVESNKDKLQFDDFFNSNVIHRDREKLYAQVNEHLNLQNEPINYLEFGVAGGDSLRWWSSNNKNIETKLWGYDTYEGLPENYGTMKKGTFDQKGNFPNISDGRINFVKGLFQDTLLKSMNDIDFSKRSIVHVDGDLYSSAMLCLNTLYPSLKKGDLIIFDEFGVPSHEFKAYLDLVSTYYLKLKPIGAINNYLQVVFEVE